MIGFEHKIYSTDVLDALTDLFILRGPLEYIRSDNSPEFVATAIRNWITAVGAKTAYIDPGSPSETAALKASILGSGTNCSTVRSSTHAKGFKSSSSGCVSITTPYDRTAL